MAAQPSQLVVDRRWVLVQAGRGAMGFAVLALAGCGGSSSEPAADAEPDPETGAETDDGAPGAADQLAWSRVDLGFVSAFVLVRGEQAAVVDTGVGGSADAIGTVLDQAGPGWDGVRHVVLTHKHPDHAGSVGEVLERATRATGYAGAADLAEVDAPRQLTPLEDGGEVFGLQVVGTPGHTPGHLAVHDSTTGVLVAGDALSNTEGRLAGSPPQFTADPAAADASVRKLARLRPRTILVGHGPPIVEEAATALQELAANLT